jgi:hypothetical protein
MMGIGNGFAKDYIVAMENLQLCIAVVLVFGIDTVYCIAMTGLHSSGLTAITSGVLVLSPKTNN